MVERVDDLDYRLELPDSLSRLHPVFHVDKLSPWKGNDVNGIIPPPPEPVELEDGTEWEVADIIDSELYGSARRRKIRYLVHWKGFTSKDDTWEPLENLNNAKEAVAEYHARHPTAPRL